MSSRHWNGDEVVLDAGRGSGRVTKIISNLVPKGKVYAVDFDQNMITTAKSNPHIEKNVKFIVADVSFVEMADRVDVVFFQYSNTLDSRSI